MDHRIVDLYNDYIHGSMPRREFLRRVARLAGGSAAAAALVPLLEPSSARAAQVDPADARLETGDVEFPGLDGTVRGYLARPRGQRTPRPAILVIHENRGLNAHIEDVARRAALQGYVALAPDGLTYAGGAPQDQEAARDLFRASDRERITADVLAGVPYLAGREDCTGSIGTVGFCYGGGVALRAAAQQPAVDAAVCFYGSALSDAQVAAVKVPLQMHYAGDDPRINAQIPAFRDALDARQVAYSLNMYPGVGHGFHNDSSVARYDVAAASLAWQRTLDFFHRNLRV